MLLHGLNYIEIGELVEINELKDIVAKEDFSRSTLRDTNDLPDNPQRETNIVLGTFNIFDAIPGYTSELVMARYYKYLDSIMEVVKAFYNYRRVTVYSFCLIRLKAGKTIYPHKDDDSKMSARYKDCKRIHIPVLTNSETLFTIGGEVKHLDYGKIFEIDNLIEHSVENNGTTDRVHILIDFIGETNYYDKLPEFPATIYID